MRLSRVKTGRDLNLAVNLDLGRLVGAERSEAGQYIITRGVKPYRHYADPPREPWDYTLQGTEHVSDLRLKLLNSPYLDNPTLITVRGTLFPSALLSSGWWERHGKARLINPRWHDHLQEWLFNGFDLWAPSWDYTWSQGPSDGSSRPFCIAQLGGGDEADSIPVVIPYAKAHRLREYLQEGWGGVEANVTGLLGHRHQFCTEGHGLELFGGLLDFCVWLNEDDRHHLISPLDEETGIYSGYLWKCVIPAAWLNSSHDLHLNQVYFIWEHTNFAKRDAVAYNLDSLAHKEEYLRAQYGDLVLIQKSSPFVPGEPEWSHEQIYNLLAGKTGPEF